MSINQCQYLAANHLPDDIQVVGADLGLPPVGLDAKEVGRLMSDEFLRPLLDDLRVIQRANHLDSSLFQILKGILKSFKTTEGQFNRTFVCNYNK